jgi:hypothetical protein
MSLQSFASAALQSYIWFALSFENTLLFPICWQDWSDDRSMTRCMATQVTLDGSGSHTHGKNDRLEALAWTDIASGKGVSVNTSIACFYPFGTHTVQLKITDNNSKTETVTSTIIVAPDSDVPGTLLEVHTGVGVDDVSSESKVYVALLPDAFAVKENPGFSNAVLRLLAKTSLPAGTVTFGFNGWSGTAQIRIDGAAVAATSSVATAGLHTLDIRCAAARFAC